MKRGIVPALAGLLCVCLLAGCGGKSKEGAVKSGLYYDASGVSPDAVLLTVDGRDIPADRYFYWLATSCDTLSESFAAQGKELDWTMELDGEKLEEYVKRQALSATALYATIEAWAEKYGCVLTEEDRAGIGDQWAEQVRLFGGEEPYLAELARLGLDRAGAERLSGDYYLYRHLGQIYREETSELYPGTDALWSYASDCGYLTVDEILISTAQVSGSDTAALAEKRERAEMVLGKLNASSDPLEYFTTLAGTYSDDNRDDYPDGFTFSAGSGVMPDAFEQAALALEENKWSGIVETDGGFYILLRKPLDLDTVAADYFDHLLQQAADGAEVTFSPAYETLSVAKFYEGLTRCRAQLSPSSSEAS